MAKRIRNNTPVILNGQTGYVLQCIRNWFIFGERTYVIVLDDDTVAYASADELFHL